MNAAFMHLCLNNYFYTEDNVCFLFECIRTSNLSVLGIDSEIRIRLNLSNVPSEPLRQKADPAFGTKIDVYFPTSFVQFSQANMVSNQHSSSDYLSSLLIG